MKIDDKIIATFLGLTVESKNWMMSPVERLTIVGLLSILRPQTALELGYKAGGCTEYLAQYSEKVWTVDMDATVLESPGRFANTIPLHMKTSEALCKLRNEGRHFQFALVDADHSVEGACRDLQETILLADVIVLHDASNPECRRGYQRALMNCNAYSNLDLVDGHLQSDGLWGGLGIVVPKLSATSISFLTSVKVANSALLRDALDKAGNNPTSILTRCKSRLGLRTGGCV
ncbi:MAG: hypothetical protein WCI03_01150 [bacterium]